MIYYFLVSGDEHKSLLCVIFFQTQDGPSQTQTVPTTKFLKKGQGISRFYNAPVKKQQRSRTQSAQNVPNKTIATTNKVSSE